MLMEEFNEYSQEIEDVGGEISNMVLGNAKPYLSKMGYKTDIGPILVALAPN